VEKQLINIVVDYLTRNGAQKISVFGSRSKGTKTPGSDLDLLVVFSNHPTLLKLIKIERKLSERTGIKIDLLTEKAISPFLIDKIKNEAQIIYPA
jgi:uncharacterized protein